MGAKNSITAKTDHYDDLYYVTPVSIGVNSYPDRLRKLIPRNTTIPTTQTFEMVFDTTCDNQEVMYFNVYLGERSKASENKLLARLDFPDIPRAPKGVEKITLSFDIDAKGTLNVCAEHKPTGRKLKLAVEGVGVKGKLVTDEEVEKMVREGEKREEDAKRAAASSAMWDYACAMTTGGDPTSTEERGSCRKKMDDMLKNVVTKMLEEFKEKVNELN